MPPSLTLAFSCPKCGAAIGSSCRRIRAPQIAHKARYRVFIRLVQDLTARGLDITDGFDCMKCGACCFAAPWRQQPDNTGPFVSLSKPDAERLARDHEGSVVPDAYPDTPEMSGLALAVSGGRCVFLTGVVGCASCSIYSERPSTCSGMTPGETACRVVRWRMGVVEVPTYGHRVQAQRLVTALARLVERGA